MKKLIMTVALTLGLATTAKADVAYIFDCIYDDSIVTVILSNEGTFVEGVARDSTFTEVLDIPSLVIRLNPEYSLLISAEDLSSAIYGVKEQDFVGYGSCFEISGTSL